MSVILAPHAVANEQYVPIEGPMFNNPRGDRPGEYMIVNEVVNMTNHAPRGSVIRVSLSHLSIPAPATALINAHNRGVKVKIIMNDDEWENRAVKRLREALGTDSSKPSYVVSRKTHTKLFMYSETGGRKQVVFTTSAPLTEYHSKDVWNDAYTLVGKDNIYTASVQFFQALVNKQMQQFPRRAHSPSYEMNLFPANDKRWGEDFFTRVLTNIDCDGGKTVVDFPTSRWRANRMDVVRQLDRLQEQGCQVRVLVFSDDTDEEIMQELYDRGLPTRVQNRPRDVPHSHVKQILISGKHFSQVVDTVYTGSANVVPIATQATPNTMLRIKNDQKIYKSFKNRMQLMWENSHTLTADNIKWGD